MSSQTVRERYASIRRATPAFTVQMQKAAEAHNEAESEHARTKAIAAPGT